MLGFEPGPHWWEASALTTAQPLLHYATIAQREEAELNLAL